MMTPLGWLERVPTFKEQQAQLQDRDLNTYGFLGYPLLHDRGHRHHEGRTVPVGEDQVFHLELAREIVRRFNTFFGAYFPEPQEFLTPIPKLPGLDGRKMSKSYNNAIYLSDSAATVTDKINPMVTDVRRKRRSDPGVPQDCPVFALQQAFSSAEEVAAIDRDCRTRGHRLPGLQEDRHPPISMNFSNRSASGAPVTPRRIWTRFWKPETARPASGPARPWPTCVVSFEPVMEAERLPGTAPTISRGRSTCCCT